MKFLKIVKNDTCCADVKANKKKQQSFIRYIYMCSKNTI